MSASSDFHVQATGPALSFDTADCHAVFYDDGNRQLLVAASSRVLSYPVDGRAADAGPTLSTDTGVGPVLAARFSLDGKVLALQRSATDVEFIVSGGASFWHRCKRPGEHLLGFFWPASVGVDFVLATSGGLELYTLQAGGGLRLVEERRRAGVQWMKYTHETRLALLGCGPSGNKLFGFQFSGSGRVKLPKFELPGDAAVTADSVRLLAVYGRLFCAHVDGAARTLVLYRFYRDALLRQHSFPLPSAAVVLSVIDNALVLHTLDSGVALVLDVLSSSLQPLASPLPLGRAGGDALPAASDLSFIPPDLVLHRAAGLLFRLRLDLRMLAASSSDRLMLVGFLQRRREPPLVRSISGEAPPAGARSPAGPKALTIGVLRTMLQERESLADLSKVFDILCAACANLSTALASLPSTPGRSEPKAAPSVPACTTDEILAEVFLPMAEEAGVDSVHLRSAAVDYLRVAEAAGLAVPPAFQKLLIDSLIMDDCAHQLPMWAPVLLPPAGQRVPPAGAASMAAEKIALVAASSSLASVKQLAVDARRRCNSHDVLVRDLLAAGEILQALRYVRRNRVESVPPAAFVEAAAAQNDPLVLASTLHFCAGNVPGFVPSAVLRSASNQAFGSDTVAV